MGVIDNATYTIRDARPDDAAALSALKIAVFRETFLEDFAIPYPPADLTLFERQSYGLEQVRRELADGSHHSWVVEESGGELVGYAHAGPCKLPNPQVRAGDWELYQIYLRRAVQGGGLGKRLLGHVLDWLAQQGGPVWLGVWSGNSRALAIYRRRGFQVVGQHHFRVGSWLDEEWTMRRDPSMMEQG